MDFEHIKREETKRNDLYRDDIWDICDECQTRHVGMFCPRCYPASTTGKELAEALAKLEIQWNTKKRIRSLKN